MWDPGVIERKQQSKVRRVLPKLFAGFTPPGFGISVAERHVILHTCGDSGASAARKGTDGDASVCEPSVDISGEPAWLQDRSALHHPFIIPPHTVRLNRRGDLQALGFYACFWTEALLFMAKKPPNEAL